MTEELFPKSVFEWGWVTAPGGNMRAYKHKVSGAVYRRMKNNRTVLAGPKVARTFRNGDPNKRMREMRRQGELDLEYPMKGYGNGQP